MAESPSLLTVMATDPVTKKVNVVIGSVGGVVTELEVFSESPRGRELANCRFRQLCRTYRVTPAQPSSDEQDVRWVVATLQT